MTIDRQRHLITATVSNQKLLDRIPYLAWLMTDRGKIIAINQQWFDILWAAYP
jgi:hypothetical protein